MLGMIRIIDQKRALVGEDRHGFLKRDAVLLSIPDFLGIVPLKSQEWRHGLQYNYTVGLGQPNGA